MAAWKSALSTSYQRTGKLYIMMTKAFIRRIINASSQCHIFFLPAAKDFTKQIKLIVAFHTKLPECGVNLILIWLQLINELLPSVELIKNYCWFTINRFDITTVEQVSDIWCLRCCWWTQRVLLFFMFFKHLLRRMSSPEAAGHSSKLINCVYRR